MAATYDELSRLYRGCIFSLKYIYLYVEELKSAKSLSERWLNAMYDTEDVDYYYEDTKKQAVLIRECLADVSKLMSESIKSAESILDTIENNMGPCPHCEAFFSGAFGKHSKLKG